MTEPDFPLGSIAASFLTETFGFGDWLPTLDDNPWVDSANTALDAMQAADEDDE